MLLKRTLLPWLATLLRSPLAAASRSIGETCLSDEYVIKRVIVIHRHGDRSQIARSAGPAFPEAEKITNAWNSNMVIPETKEQLAKVARKRTAEKNHAELESEPLLYTGRDKDEFPYGQLTELGAQQMIAVGTALRERYQSLLHATMPLSAPNFYCRTTNLCRTNMSLRALLVGLLDTKDLATSVITIDTRAKQSETMYPDCNDEPCQAMLSRRKVLYDSNYIANNFPGYSELEAKFKSVLGYTERMSWLTAREVLFAQEIHGIEYTTGLSSADIDKSSALAGFMWGRLFKDQYMNRLSIGRFVREILRDLKAALAADSPVKFLIYSGHDSTLVPILCALDMYDDVWPPYAAYLSLEIAHAVGNEKELFVRANYNGEYKHMFKETTLWCPYDTFLTHMNRFAISSSEYAHTCKHGATETITEEEAAAMSDEVKATISSK